MKTDIFAENVMKSKRVFKAFSFNDFSLINGPKITILIYLNEHIRDFLGI